MKRTISETREDARQEILRLHPNEIDRERVIQNLCMRASRAVGGLEWCEAYLVVAAAEYLVKKMHAEKRVKG
jgi:hypothetical protein